MNDNVTEKESPFLLILAFFAIYFIWGTTYLAVLFGLESFPPFILSTVRFTIAGVALVLWALVKKERFPSGNDLTITIASGIIMLVGGSGLIAWAEQYIPSGQAAIVVATEPFMFLLLDKKRWPLYFAQKSIIVGLIMGFVGITIFFMFTTDPTTNVVPFHLKLAGLTVLFVSGLFWVVGSLYSKTKKDETVSNTATTGIQLLAAAAFTAILVFITGENKQFHFSAVTAKAWWSMIYLITGGSILAFLAFNWLIRVRPPAQVSTHTYVNPIIAVLAGWFIVHEPLSFIQVIGLIIILVGVLLANKNVDSI